MFQSAYEQPQWRVVYDRLVIMEIDDVVSYEELQTLCPDMEFSAVRALFFQAKRHVLRDRQRAFENVRNVGYRMVHPRDQGRLATRHERKARRQATKALDLVTEVEYTMLSQAERRQISDLEKHYRDLKRFMKQLSQKHDRLEQRVSVTEKDQGLVVDRTEELAAQVAKINDLLLKHGLLGTEQVS